MKFSVHLHNRYVKLHINFHTVEFKLLVPQPGNNGRAGN